MTSFISDWVRQCYNNTFRIQFASADYYFLLIIIRELSVGDTHIGKVMQLALGNNEGYTYQRVTFSIDMMNRVDPAKSH